MYVEAVRDHNPPEDHDAFWQMLFIVLVPGCTRIWKAEGLEFVP